MERGCSGETRIAPNQGAKGRRRNVARETKARIRSFGERALEALISAEGKRATGNATGYSAGRSVSES